MGLQRVRHDRVTNTFTYNGCLTTSVCYTAAVNSRWQGKVDKFLSSPSAGGDLTHLQGTGERKVVLPVQYFPSSRLLGCHIGKVQEWEPLTFKAYHSSSVLQDGENPGLPDPKLPVHKHRTLDRLNNSHSLSLERSLNGAERGAGWIRKSRYCYWFFPLKANQGTRLSVHPLQISWFIIPTLGFPGGAISKEPPCQCRRHRRHRFNPWIRKIPWRRKWQLTPVFLPGESVGQRSLAGYSPQGDKESDRTEAL